MPPVAIRPIKKVLIANRGEIACRVMRTCARLGIATVAVYSDADKYALHVEIADQSVHIGPPAARESYLSIDNSVEVTQTVLYFLLRLWLE
jgi:acetyl/propionyl-CoA carboxylase alpha subunit